MGRKPIQNQLLLETVEGLPQKERISLSQKELVVAKWNGFLPRKGKIAAFPRKPSHRRSSQMALKSASA